MRGASRRWSGAAVAIAVAASLAAAAGAGEARAATGSCPPRERAPSLARAAGCSSPWHACFPGFSVPAGGGGAQLVLLAADETVSCRLTLELFWAAIHAYRGTPAPPPRVAAEDPATHARVSAGLAVRGDGDLYFLSARTGATYARLPWATFELAWKERRRVSAADASPRPSV